MSCHEYGYDGKNIPRLGLNLGKIALGLGRIALVFFHAVNTAMGVQKIRVSNFMRPGLQRFDNFFVFIRHRGMLLLQWSGTE